ncbi:MAG: response regulator [Nitrospirae bacterium]|nr:response regulator [Nitrospirota bacterium]
MRDNILKKPQLNNNKVRIVIIIIMLLISILILGITVLWTKSKVLTKIQEDIHGQIDIYNTYISTKLSNYSMYPAILAENELILSYFNNPNDTNDINNYLSRFNSTIGAAVTYLIDKNGKAIASSNWNAPDSFLGKNYSFRQYFINAMKGNPDKYIALGVVSKKLGYYVSHPVRKGNDIIGIAVIKYDFSILKLSSFELKGKLFIADKNNIIFASNDDNYLYYSMYDLPESTLTSINKSKQYEGVNIVTLPIISETTYNNMQIVTLGNISDKKTQNSRAANKIKYIKESFRVSETGWNVYMFVEITGVNKEIIMNLSIVSFLIAVLFSFLLLIANIRLRRRHVELFKRGDELEHLVQERTEELIEAKEKALGASMEKSRFLASMSHEIRTPLHAILAMAELLQETDLSDMQRDYVNIFQSSGENLLYLINDIIDVSKAEAGRIDLESVDFNLIELKESICDLMGIKAQEKGIELVGYIDSNVPEMVTGDSVRLRQVLVNLIGNAIKFTDKGEVILKCYTLSDYLTQGGVCKEIIPAEINDGDSLRLIFLVIDSGIGIAEDKHNVIFDCFTQADSSTTRKYGGTGLGLNISKKLVQLMNGDIWVTSEGKGSTFYFTAAFGLPDEVNASIQHEPLLKDNAVLIIDDNDTNRLLLKNVLKGFDASIYEAVDGERGLYEINNKIFNMVFIDCDLPDIDGFTIAEKIKLEYPLIKIVMMFTTYNKGQLIEMATTIGIDTYITKPIKRKDIYKALNYITCKYDNIGKSSDVCTIDNIPPIKILLVEDYKLNRYIIKHFFKNTSVRIDEAENGAIGVDKYSSGTYDIVLMDIQMPVMDGYTAAKEIRKYEREQGKMETPIIALTASTMKEDIQKCIDAGCNEHLSKPLKKNTLIENILRFIKSDFISLNDNIYDDEVQLVNDNNNSTIIVDAELADVIPEFISSINDDLITINNSLKENDYETTRRLAHSIKGAGGIYGFDIVTEQAALLEILIKENNQEEAIVILNKISSYIKNVQIVYE